MPAPQAQAAAPAYQAPGSTSGKEAAPAAAGSPSSRHSTVTSMARVMGSIGEKAVPLVP